MCKKHYGNCFFYFSLMFFTHQLMYVKFELLEYLLLTCSTRNCICLRYKQFHLPIYYSIECFYCIVCITMLMFFFCTILDVEDWRWLRVLTETSFDGFEYLSNKVKFFQLRRILFYFEGLTNVSLGLQIPHFGSLYIPKNLMWNFFLVPLLVWS